MVIPFNFMDKGAREAWIVFATSNYEEKNVNSGIIILIRKKRVSDNCREKIWVI